MYNIKKKTCKLCRKQRQHLAVTTHPRTTYTICWDCLIELDINHKDIKKYIDKVLDF